MLDESIDERLIKENEAKRTTIIDLDIDEQVNVINNNEISERNTYNIKLLLLLFSCIAYLLIILIGFIAIVYLSIGGFNKNNIINNINGEKIKQYKYYTVSFNSSIQLPNYTLYNLNTVVKRCQRSDWSRDNDLNTRMPDSFGDWEYDRGHLVPAIDVKDTCSTFMMSNAIPQFLCFNRIIWFNLEKYIRNNFMNHDVLTVPEYNNNKYIYDNYDKKLLIPTGFYKIIMLNNKIVWNIYIEHNTNVCYQDFNVVGNKKKLPYFIYN